MKLFEKVKNLFTEEVEEDLEPVTKEVIQVEIPAPERAKKNANLMMNDRDDVPVRETEVPKEEKFVFPVYFDDKDFDRLEKEQEKIVKPTPKPTITPKPVIKKEERKVFKPSLIISPVYGVLDKNYRKEDIATKVESNPSSEYRSGKDLSIDDVRKKAFGTLEDDLERTMISNLKNVPTKQEDEKEEPGIDIFNDLEMNASSDYDAIPHRRLEHTQEEDDLLNMTNLDTRKTEIDESNALDLDLDLGSLDEDILSIQTEARSSETDDSLDDLMTYQEDEADEISLSPNTEEVEEALEDIASDDSSLTESDLFRLVDSMYEEDDEKEEESE